MKFAFIALCILGMVSNALAQQATTNAPQKSIAETLGLSLSPAKNQTQAQQREDEKACYALAKKESGLDPSPTPGGSEQGGTTTAAQAATSSDPLAALAGKLPPPPGSAQTTTGADPLAELAGKLPPPPTAPSPSANSSDPLAALAAKLPPPPGAPQAQQPNQQSQPGQTTATPQDKIEGFKKIFSSCMETKGYSVK